MGFAKIDALTQDIHTIRIVLYIEAWESRVMCLLLEIEEGKSL